MKKEEISSILSGISGEYFVAAELSRRGFITTLTLKNTKGVDVLASNEKATQMIAIQVKTTKKSKNEWMLKDKSEDFVSDKHFYVFVRLNNVGELPSFHIVPSKEVAKYIKRTHQEWLIKPAKNGKAHKDNPMRIYRDIEEKFKDRWDLLK